jgi:hypothetical protein
VAGQWTWHWPLHSCGCAHTVQPPSSPFPTGVEGSVGGLEHPRTANMLIDLGLPWPCCPAAAGQEALTIVGVLHEAQPTGARPLRLGSGGRAPGHYPHPWPLGVLYLCELTQEGQEATGLNPHPLLGWSRAQSVTHHAGTRAICPGLGLHAAII